MIALIKDSESAPDLDGMDLEEASIEELRGMMDQIGISLPEESEEAKQ